MRIERLTFQQTFPTGQFQNQKLGMEVSVGEDLSTEETTRYFKVMKEEIEKAFTALNPQINWNTMPPYGAPIEYPNHIGEPNERQPRDTVDNIIEDINSVKELKVLESYKLIAKTNERIMNAYNEKLKSFQ